MIFGSGCGSQIADLTDDQRQQVGEYAAFTLLRYDAESRSRLVDYSEVEAADEALRRAEEAAKQAEEAKRRETEEAKPAGTYDSEGKLVEVVDSNADTAVQVSMEEFLGLSSGVSLTYEGYTLQDSYPEEADISDYFVVDAAEGKKFVVLWYSLSNGSGLDESINFLSDSVSFKCKVNDEVTVTALVTMLSDDMATLQTDLKPGEGTDCVLIFEVKESVADSVESLVVRMSKPGSEWENKVL